MAWCFRYRVKTATRFAVPENGYGVLSLPKFPEITVTDGQAGTSSSDQAAEQREDDRPAPPSRWKIFKCCGFDTEDDARRAGELLGDVLAAAGASEQWGIHVGHNRSTLQFSTEINAAVLAATGVEPRGEIHGLDIYRAGTVGYFRSNMVLSTSPRPLATLEAGVAVWCEPTRVFSERHRTCAALLNDSFFVPHTEAQFILRVSAVEALCDPADVGEEYRRVVDELETHLANVTTDGDVLAALGSQLKWLKKQSVRQAYLRKFGSRLSESDAKAFDGLYQKRSAYVHDGKGRGDLAAANNEALDLAVALYKADVAAHQELAGTAGATLGS